VWGTWPPFSFGEFSIAEELELVSRYWWKIFDVL
jgi:hypothetical protein